jgi:hypothetical protein
MKFFVQVGEVEFPYTIVMVDDKRTMLAETNQKALAELAAAALGFKHLELKPIEEAKPEEKPIDTKE